MSNVADRVRDIVSMYLGVDQSKVVPEAFLVADLDADSLDKMELLIAIEEEFHIEIPDDEAARAKTVRDVIEYVTTATSEQYA